MSDLISRKDAIDVASRECHEWRGIFYNIEQGLKDLPSSNVHGEWISICNGKQCNCSICGKGYDHTYEFIGKWWDKQEMSLQGRCGLFQMYPTGEWYCGNAKLRSDSDD